MEELPNNSRRDFIKLASLGMIAGCSSFLPAMARNDDQIVKLTILHTNDVHSHIDPFDDNHPRFPGMGGVAVRSAMIKKIRQEERNVLLLDAGDIFQGTPYFNMFGGELEMKLMSLMGYDAATIGNHEFDNGMEGLAKQLTHAHFPLVNCNYDFSGTLMEGKSIPYKILIKQGIKIGVFGVGVELSGLVDKKLYGNTKYLDPIAKANEISLYLKSRKKCHLVVCLSHLGHSFITNKVSDLKLAKESTNIDLIIGGHTHTFLEEPVKESNLMGREVIVTQAGWAGLRLGRLDYNFEKKTGRKINSSSTVMEMKKSSEI